MRGDAAEQFEEGGELGKRRVVENTAVAEASAAAGGGSAPARRRRRRLARWRRKRERQGGVTGSNEAQPWSMLVGKSAPRGAASGTWRARSEEGGRRLMTGGVQQAPLVQQVSFLLNF